MKYKAIEKLNSEFKGYTKGGFAKVILEPTVNAIKGFCENEKFAEAVVNQPKTIGELCEEIVKPIKKQFEKLRTKEEGVAFSDIEAYRQTAAFYMPGVDIKFSMEIILPEEKKSDKIIKLSLESFI